MNHIKQLQDTLDATYKLRRQIDMITGLKSRDTLEPMAAVDLHLTNAISRLSDAIDLEKVAR